MNKIVLVTDHFSVVVKGLEKKLTNLRYEVKVTDGGFLKITEDDYGSDAILLYLSDDLLDNHSRIIELTKVCDRIRDSNCGLLVIGRPGKSHELFLKAVPRLKEFVWIDQPVDVNLLSEKLEKEIENSKNRTSKKKVLIVDDDPLYGMMVSNWLKYDYTVSMVTDGMETISFLTNNTVDLILLDYEMPVVDGPKLLQMLRTHPETENIPVMFLTGVRDRESIQRVISLKPEGYILKSAARDEILKILVDFFRK